MIDQPESIDQPGSSEGTLQGGAARGQPQSSADAVGQLTVYFEGRIARVLSLNVPVVTIGRTPANVLPLPHPSISRAHAELRVTAEAVILTDLGSSNGTFVEDVRLAPQQPVQLVSGNTIRIGPFVMRYESAAALASEPPRGLESDGQPETLEPAPALSSMPPAVFSPAPAPRNTHASPLPTEVVSSYLDFLPVIFQDGDFLGRFLLIFQSIWEPLEYREDHLAMYFDPRTCPTAFLHWLADWLGVVVGPVSEEGRLRALLGEAVELYRWRGTRYGLARMIEVCTGLTPLVAEAANNPAVLHIRVAVPSESSIDRDTIERLVKINKPAHTAYLLEVV